MVIQYVVWSLGRMAGELAPVGAAYTRGDGGLVTLASPREASGHDDEARGPLPPFGKPSPTRSLGAHPVDPPLLPASTVHRGRPRSHVR